MDTMNEEHGEVTAVKRLRNSLAGNPRFELVLSGLYRRRTAPDSQAGLDVAAIVGGPGWQVDAQNVLTPDESFGVVLRVDDHGAVRGVTVIEEEGKS